MKQMQVQILKREVWAGSRCTAAWLRGTTARRAASCRRWARRRRRLPPCRLARLAAPAVQPQYASRLRVWTEPLSLSTQCTRPACCKQPCGPALEAAMGHTLAAEALCASTPAAGPLPTLQRHCRHSHSHSRGLLSDENGFSGGLLAQPRTCAAAPAPAPSPRASAAPAPAPLGCHCPPGAAGR
jgi:hypothetical protein